TISWEGLTKSPGFSTHSSPERVTETRPLDSTTRAESVTDEPAERPGKDCAAANKETRASRRLSRPPSRAIAPLHHPGCLRPKRTRPLLQCERWIYAVLVRRPNGTKQQANL